MVQIFDSLKALINPELSKIAGTLGEHESKVTTASSGILSGILAKLLQKGDTAHVDTALKEGGKANILPHLASIFSGNGTSEQEATGNKLIRAIMGDHADDFTKAAASDAGISQTSANKLTTVIATAVAGFLGNRLNNGSAKTADLINDLSREKNHFMGLVPAGVKNTLGLNGKYTNAPQDKKKGNYNWLIWLLLAIALILLIIFGWRSCKGKTPAEVAEAVEVRTEQVINNAKAAVQNVERALTEFTLPNGMKIQAYKGGMEEKMIAFLNSDAYKNAKTDADLKNKWFEFEDVDFLRDSATELSQGAAGRLANIAAILQAYPQAKIKIAGNADKSGNRIYNMEISKERAETVKSLLSEDGVAAGRIMTDGFGDEQATWPADATAAQSAPDRDIAFRFMK